MSCQGGSKRRRLEATQNGRRALSTAAVGGLTLSAKQILKEFIPKR